MSIDIQQTDTAPTITNAVFCSGGSINGTFPPLKVYGEVGGTPGVTPVTTNVSSVSIPGEVHMLFECGITNGLTWAAGTATLRLNVGAIPSGQGRIDNIYYCRVDSGNTSVETLGTSSPGTSLTPSAVNSFNTTLAATTPSAGDKVVIVVQMTNPITMSTAAVPVTPDQIITLPFVAPVSGPPVGTLPMMGCGR